MSCAGVRLPAQASDPDSKVSETRLRLTSHCRPHSRLRFTSRRPPRARSTLALELGRACQCLGRAELRRERVDLSELARAVLARLPVAQPDREVEIVVEPGLVAEADPRLLEVVLANLLGNAWKFTGKRASARIELAALAGQRPAVYLVRDNGAGFERANASKLVGVFERLHPAHELEGTGIALATVQRIVRRHGGRIWAEGEVDRGGTFYFTLEGEPT